MVESALINDQIGCPVLDSLCINVIGSMAIINTEKASKRFSIANMCLLTKI